MFFCLISVCVCVCDHYWTVHRASSGLYPALLALHMTLQFLTETIKMHLHTQSPLHMYTLTHEYLNARIYTHTSRIHKHIHMRTRGQVRTRAHTYTYNIQHSHYTHTYTAHINSHTQHTHTHATTHTHTHCFSVLSTDAGTHA